MKIIWLIPLTVDSAYQFTSRNELAGALKKIGCKVKTIVAFRKKKLRLSGFSTVKYVHTPKESVFGKLKFFLKMLDAIRKEDADFVILGLSVIHLLLIAKILGIRKNGKIFILDIRSVPVDVKFNIRGIKDVIWYKLAICLADFICDGLTVITPELKRKLKPRLRRLRGKVGIWSSGVNFELFEREGESFKDELEILQNKVIVHHGIISPNRGLKNVIEAIALIEKQIPELIFLIIGEGEGLVELEDTANKLGIKSKIRFTGKVPYLEVPQYIRSADLAILPFPNISWWSVSSPLKLMEYLAMGIPVVATDIPAHREIAENIGGIILARNCRPENLANAIKLALRKKNEPVCLEFLKDNISWDSQAIKLIEFLKRLKEQQRISHSPY